MPLATNKLMMRVSNQGFSSKDNDYTRYVVCTGAGTLGFYSSNTSRHIKKTVLAFRYSVQAQGIADTIRNSTGVDVWVEERKSGDILDEEKRKARARKKYGKGKED